MVHERQKTTFREATAGNPCPVCNSKRKCSRGADGSIMCGHPPGNVPGFVFLGYAKGDPQFGVYRHNGDPVLGQNGSTRKHSGSIFQQIAEGPSQTNSAFAQDWAAKAEEYAQNLTPATRQELAEVLGPLPECVLAELPGLGWDPTEKCWTFPESSGTGQIIGINRRYRNGKKKAMPGGSRGLIIPKSCRETPGPLLQVEGASDVLACAAIGLAAIGRPSNMGGVEHLADALRDLPKDRPIIVVGEWDPKANGHWPGKEGAVATASRLQELLDRPVQWTLPPDGAKDIRQWVTNKKLDPTCADGWQDVGEALLTAWNGKYNDPPRPTNTADPAPAGLATTSLASIRPESLDWLVFGYIPLGKLMLTAGDGGHGKSTLTLDLSACLTTGRPCFGLAYEPLPPCEVLLLGCEDDYGDTVVPRLIAAGADRQKIFRIDGIKSKEGKTLPFNLSHYEALERELTFRPMVRLVVIDPAGAYIGKTGRDDYNDSELRSLLGPLAELAAKRRVTILLVKHLVKGATTKAVHKVGGSTGYVNSVRAAFIVAPSQEDEEVKLFLPLKFNLGPKPAGLSYRLQELSDDECLQHQSEFSHLEPEEQARLRRQLFRVQWQGTVNVEADSIFAQTAKQDRGPTKVKQAAEWLKNFLSEFAFPSEEIVAEARAAGFTFDNIKEAKALLKSEDLRSTNRGDFQGKWWCGFGDRSTWHLRPDPNILPLTPQSPFTPQSPHTPHYGPNSEENAAATPIVGKVGSVGSGVERDSEVI